jgi:hypothetical protein
MHHNLPLSSTSKTKQKLSNYGEFLKVLNIVDYIFSKYRSSHW